MAKKKIDPLNKKQHSAVSAALTVSDIPAAVSFYQKAFGFSKRGIMNGPDGNTDACGTHPARHNSDARSGESCDGKAEREERRRLSRHSLHIR